MSLARKVISGTLLLLGTLPLLDGAPPTGSGSGTTEEQELYRQALLLVRTMKMLRQNYVDEQKVSYEELFRHAMRGMVSALDPYSDYEPPSRFKEEQIRRQGSTEGIGAMAVKPDGKPVTIIRVLPNGPAEKAGIRAGDQIVEIDGRNVAPLNLSRALELLRGPAGSTVTLSLRRNLQTLTRKVVRARVTSPSVPPDSVRLTAGKVGYLKLLSFTKESPREVADALKKLHALGAESIILDLRYNPGGLVESAKGVAACFLPPGTVLFRARSRGKQGEQVVKTPVAPFSDIKTPLIVMINAFSASCSEILTGALQDHKRAKVLGVRSFGKGTILHVVPLPGGGAVRYASAHYVTPGGRVIEKRGIIPDHEVRIPTYEVLRLSSQTLRYPGRIKPDPRATLRDLQLARAVELLRKPPRPPAENE